jgi:paraquat-inducible protein A
VSVALACAIATLLLLVPANLLPLMSVSMLGVERESRVIDGITALWSEHWLIVAVLVAAFVIFLPFVRCELLTLVLGSVHLRCRPAWLGAAFRWSHNLDQWAMPDVFLIGLAVGYTRVATNLTVEIRPGGLCMIAAALLCILSRSTLDRRTVWRYIEAENALLPDGDVIACKACELVASTRAEGQRCARCGLHLYARKTDSRIRTWALLVAALCLYIPANTYPMSTVMQLGQQTQHRIIDGIQELFAAGLWPLGILVFTTSIAIPLLKLIGLGWCLLSTRGRFARRLHRKARLYRFIDEIGRWSYMDVFTIAVFVPLMQFDGLVGAKAAPGATAFVLVVFLTMLASQTFDPRLMWDARERAS